MTNTTRKPIYIYTLDRQGNDRTFSATAVQDRGGRTPRQQYRTIVQAIDREGSTLYEVRLLRDDGTVIDQHTAE